LIVTREELEKKINELRSPNGGWLKKDLLELGVMWPPQKGWREKLLQGYDD
jgi:hypothetical protein